MKKVFALILALAMALVLCAGSAMADADTVYTVTAANQNDVVSGPHKRIIVESGVTEVTFENVTVTNPGKAGNSGASALEVQDLGSVTLIFKGSNTLTGGNGTRVDMSAGGGGSGILAYGGIEIVVEEGGSLSATGGRGTMGMGMESGDGGTGIYAGANVMVSGGVVTAEGGDGGKNNASTLGGNKGGDGGDGIYAGGNVTVNGGMMKATGGKGGDSDGRYRSGGKGGDGITAGMGIEIGDGVADGGVHAEGGQGGKGYENRYAEDGKEGSFSETQKLTMDKQPDDDRIFVYAIPDEGVPDTSDLPQTGDPSMLGAWTLLLGAAGMGLKMKKKS